MREDFGPLTAVALLGRDGRDVIEILRLEQGSGTVIARMPLDHESWAYARLFAAAPLMLALLRKRVEPFCPVTVQDEIRALLKRIDTQ